MLTSICSFLSWLLIARHSFRVCFIGISGAFFCAIVFNYFGEAKLNQNTYESGYIRSVTWGWQNWASDWLVTNAAVGTVHNCNFFSKRAQNRYLKMQIMNDSMNVCLYTCIVYHKQYVALLHMLETFYLLIFLKHSSLKNVASS